MKKALIIPFIMMSSMNFTTTASADEYLDASKKMCEKVKTCTLSKIGDVPQSIRDMMNKSLENMCNSLIAQYTPDMDKSHIKPAALKCIKSFSNLSCSQLESMNDNTTPECRELEELVEDD